MNAHKIETSLTEDGTLVLKGLPFHAGDVVEVIILQPQTAQHQIKSLETQNTNLYPLRGKVIRYDDPTEPVALDED
ncbi:MULTISPECIES: hypothetical protein [Aphanizomenonaceae]|uniref:Uncharacterized protein n=1 Tax=Dolichospermum compactum NIES-806 TaxID=1973481 RepID=A0A1Z4V689_9CYAN|nr:MULTISPECIES: hypothetical protein [Aphanizomenonaceae]MTJ28431.1 hypothetical protein [Aphanizomenon sp. UHCC 0183]BAZ87070.1 hypothetical protein NIES806_32880 [Dolichospermum compactum NIES-806]